MDCSLQGSSIHGILQERILEWVAIFFSRDFYARFCISVFLSGCFLQCSRPGLHPWIRKIPWRREWLPTPVFLPRESHGQRSLAGYSPQGLRVGHWSDLAHMHAWGNYTLRVMGPKTGGVTYEHHSHFTAQHGGDSVSCFAYIFSYGPDDKSKSWASPETAERIWGLEIFYPKR